MTAPADVIQQHLIDPEICIRCNTCEATCPESAITHDSRNYVVDASICNLCMACVPPCPTGSIDNWRTVLRAKAYSVKEQLQWDELPVVLNEEGLTAPVEKHQAMIEPVGWGSIVPPASAEQAHVHLFKVQSPAVASVVGNFRVNDAGTDNETHHIVLDMGTTRFPVLEGQSIGVIAPGVDANAKVHYARQYSIASARDGERAGYNNLSLTVKRVKENHQGETFNGVCSNYLCDLKVGDQVQVTGPFGSSFLMPNHPHSHLVMICTGTGSAPMRAMTEWRRRLRVKGQFESGKLMLFFGARTQEELPYFGPLQKLSKDFIDINFAFSRTKGQEKKYVQDVMLVRSADLGVLLKDPLTHFYVCGLKSMEDGVMAALQTIAQQAGLDWPIIGKALQIEGRLHLETY
ncbi:MAG: benzoyl-CoA 2,3-epoxidase subunit BoxA [Limnohabitans sp.]|nr:benzoyl-CoA 2,3-epoxidase subunit BoxA [Limnohabitans sp.]